MNELKLKLFASMLAAVMSSYALASPPHYATVTPVHQCTGGGDGTCEHVGDIVDVFVDTRADAGLEGGVYIGARLNQTSIGFWTPGAAWQASDEFMRIPPAQTFAQLPNGYTRYRVLNGERRVCDRPTFGRYNRVEIAVGYGAVQPEFYPRIELHERLKHDHSLLTTLDLKASYAHIDLFGQMEGKNPKWRVVLDENCNWNDGD